MSRQNTIRLPAGVRDATTEPSGCRHEASHTFVTEASVERVFALFDPVSERDWVDDWNPVPIYPAALSRLPGAVFTIARDGRTAVWTTLQYSPVQHVAEYLVIEHQYQHRWISVSCDAKTDQTSQVSVRYVTTALSADGQRDLYRYGSEFLRAWEAPVQSALDRSAEQQQ